MDGQYIKIAQYADFKGKTKQAIYQSKKIKKTVLEDGSKVIMFKDLPEEEAKEAAVYLEKCLSVESSIQSTDEKAAMQEKFNAILLEHAELLKEHNALVAEHAKLLEEHAAMVKNHELMKQARDNAKHDLEKEKEITQLVKDRCKDLEHDKQELEKDKQNLQERCKEANILLLQKIPNAWNPRRLLPWNWGKKQEEI